MDRQLLSKILMQMKKQLKEGKQIGDLKVGALLALGHQLQAIMYYLGHELSSMITNVSQCTSSSEISEALKDIIKEYHIGDVEILETGEETIQLRLRGHSSIKDLVNTNITTEGNFCSFEAGLLAGFVEKMSNIPCFGQELNCALNTDDDYCDFMIVFQND